MDGLTITKISLECEKTGEDKTHPYIADSPTTKNIFQYSLKCTEWYNIILKVRVETCLQSVAMKRLIYNLD